jgi:hypothetical protein
MVTECHNLTACGMFHTAMKPGLSHRQ